MAAGRLWPVLRWWMVEHPGVASFEWDEGRTWGASRGFAAAAVLAYLALTLLLHALLLPHTRRSPHLRLFLRLVSPLHNALLLLLSLAMAAGCSLAAASQMPAPSWLFCFPRGATPARGPVFFWAYVFYLSKFYELADTLLILLAADRRRRLSLLHVYHHAAVVGVCRLWLTAPQSLMPVALVTNAAVHVVMYGYYLCSSVGWRWSPRWKRLVTDCQIVQFCFSFAVSLVFLWLHFSSPSGEGCSGFWAWVLNAVFNASLLALFLDFHKANYKSSKLKADEKTH